MAHRMPKRKASTRAMFRLPSSRVRGNSRARPLFQTSRRSSTPAGSSTTQIRVYSPQMGQNRARFLPNRVGLKYDFPDPIVLTSQLVNKDLLQGQR